MMATKKKTGRSADAAAGAAAAKAKAEAAGRYKKWSTDWVDPKWNPSKDRASIHYTQDRITGKKTATYSGFGKGKAWANKMSNNTPSQRGARSKAQRGIKKV